LLATGEHLHFGEGDGNRVSLPPLLFSPTEGTIPSKMPDEAYIAESVGAKVTLLPARTQAVREIAAG
jgi:hypothetical protein